VGNRGSLQLARGAAGKLYGDLLASAVATVIAEAQLLGTT
jgi:hypothetical protein